MAKSLLAGGLAAVLLAGCMPGAEAQRQRNMAEPVAAVSGPGLQELIAPTATSSKTNGKGSLRYSSSASLSSGQEAAIMKYFDAYFNSLCNLKADDPASLFSSGARTQYLRNLTVWEVHIEVRKMQKANLKLSGYTYDLLVQKISKTSDGDYDITLRENNVQRFAGFPGVNSEYMNISHRFILREENGTWKIRAHNQVDAITSMIVGGSSKQSNAKDYLDKRKKTVLNIAKKDTSARQQQMGKSYSTSLKWDNDYNRKAAVAYAQEWVGKRNSSFATYDRSGGNCNNFTSQCVYAGGIPMDYSGAQQWKWYGNASNTAQQAAGRSASWSSVSAFYTYARNNTGYGLVADVSPNYYAGEPGDIIQMGFSGNWRHTVLITEVVKDSSGRTIDYLVSSNTADLRNYPVSAYVYTQQRLIKIHGWNGTQSTSASDDDTAQEESVVPSEEMEAPELEEAAA